MKRNYWITIILIFILRATDLFLTWIYTPELADEYNPIVSILGHSWAGLIGTQLIFLLVISLFGGYYFFKPRRKVEQKGLPFSDFIYCFFFHELKPWPQRFFSKIKDKDAHMQFNGFMFLSVAILISLFAIVNNGLLIADAGWYVQFLTDNFSIFFPTIFVGIAACSAFLFFGKEYLSYKKYQGEL